MTPASPLGVRGRWLVLGGILWLTLASSITLEQGQESAAQWGSAATLAVLGILVLLADLPSRVDPGAGPATAGYAAGLVGASDEAAGQGSRGQRPVWQRRLSCPW